MSGARHDTVEAYKNETDNSHRDIRPPKDGAVLYTNNGRDRAHAYVEEQRNQGKEATILEQTKHGQKLDQDKLFDRSDPRTNQLELNQAQKINRETGKVSLDKHNAATQIWDHESKTFGEQASGRVTVVANDRPIKENSFFARNEREALIRNPNVTHINGVERKELERQLDKVENAKAREANSMTQHHRAKAQAEYKDALRELNCTIEKNDPTRDKSKDKPAPEPEKTSAWKRHGEAKHSVDTPVKHKTK